VDLRGGSVKIAAVCNKKEQKRNIGVRRGGEDPQKRTILRWGGSFLKPGVQKKGKKGKGEGKRTNESRFLNAGGGK